MIQFFSETAAMAAGDTDDAVTDLLRRWVDGDTPAGDRLFTRVYEELRVVARRQRQRWNGEDTLNTTALVHEVFLRMNGAGAIAVHDRAHFYALAARATRPVKRASASKPLWTLPSARTKIGRAAGSRQWPASTTARGRSRTVAKLRAMLAPVTAERSRSSCATGG